MPAPTILTASEIAEALAGLPGWAEADGKLHKTYEFANFSEAFGFMTRAALAAERMDHHPDWCNSYRTVRVTLVTHASGGITRLDLALAAEMERLAPATRASTRST